MLNQSGKNLDVSAKTVDEAIEQGLARLGLSRDEVDIEILKEGRKGVFGLGAEEALVRLTPRLSSVQAEERPQPKAPVSSPKVAVDLPGDWPAADTDSLTEEVQESAVPAPGSGEKNLTEIAEYYLNGLLERMGLFKSRISSRLDPELVEEGEEPPLVLNITGQDLGILIGRRSETLQALQYMLRLMVSKEMGGWQPIVVDVESYRVRRRQSLHRMAEKMAERAVSSRKRVVLEAMPAYERRVIHVALKNHPAVITKSIGSDENRKVTIIPK
jgi:spoIIIJ-associated protein